jgi:oligo-1,6-glucosidase
MTNAGFTKIEDYRDMPTLNEYQHQKNIGGDLQKFMKRIAFECRDNGRTPFQWNDTANAGFTTGTPWLQVNKNYKSINEAGEEKDPNSTLNYFREIVKFRKNNLVLVYGKYTLLDKGNPNAYCYTRELNGKKLLILLNFTDKTAITNTGINFSVATVMLGNYSSPSADGTLKPYEAVIYEIK